MKRETDHFIVLSDRASTTEGRAKGPIYGLFVKERDLASLHKDEFLSSIDELISELEIIKESFE